MSAELMTAREALVQGLSQMHGLQHVVRDTHGNLSVRDVDVMWVKPSGMAYDQISQGDLCGFDVAGDVALPTNSRRPSVDSPHHLSIYRRHPWVGAVCHTHSPHATAFAWAHLSLPCHGTEHADVFGKTVRCLPYSGLDTWGERVELELGERAVLLAGHGVLTFAESPRRAVELAAALENVAQKAFLARQLVPFLGEMPESEARRWHERYNGGGYGQ